MHLVVAICLSAMTAAPGPGPKPAPVENVSTFAPRSPADERKALHVPEGFEIQLVASEPEIQKPMNIAFDDRGRLWVTGSVEYPFPPKDGKRPRDSVRILEDFGPDGRARKVSVFADGLNIPIGLLPLTTGDGALVYSIPTIDRYTDTDGDGRADRREPLFQSYGFGDTHGMTGSFTWGFDGWFYACHGFANTSTVRGTDRAPITMNSGNVYRLKPDGSHAEYFTHGQVNPFGLTFDPLGNLYSSDCHSRPLYLLLRGAYYPSFGKPDEGLGFGPEMMSHDHNSTAIDGATYYAADQFPEPFRGDVFIGNVVTNRVNRDRLEWHGSSPKAIEQPDLVWSEDNWFRPVDIELGPDGAIYVADFYNRIIGHYEVPLTHPGRDHDHGRIWRIVYRGPDGKGRAKAPRRDWINASVSELIEDLGHPNLAVRIKAANQLSTRPAAELESTLKSAVVSDPSPERRAHALWVLFRLGVLDDSTLEKTASDSARLARVHVMRVIGERPLASDSLLRTARQGLRDGDPFVRGAAAEALARHPEFENLQPLLALRRSTPADDTHLIHVLRMALRDQLRPATAWRQLEAYEQNEGDAQAIADVATGVPSPESARFLLHRIEQTGQRPDAELRYVHHVARYGDADARQELLGFVRRGNREGLVHRANLLKEIQQGTQERGMPLGGDLRNLALEVTRALLGSKRDGDVLAGIALTSSFSLRELRGQLEALAETPKSTDAQRLESITALVAMDPKGSVRLLGRVLGDSSATPPVRERAAASLATIDQPEAQAELLEFLPTAPDILQTTIAAGLATRRRGGEALLEAVSAGKASARLLQESRVAGPLANTRIPNLKDRLDTLLKGLPPADQRLRDLIDKRRTGFVASGRDSALGAKAFEKNCAICHQIGGKGARIGPQLDGVGNRGVDRLLEDLLDPSRNVDQAFRLSSLALTNGQIITGLLLKEEGEVFVLADAQGKEVRVAKTMVEERTISQLSPMPANLSEQIPETDFYDLLAYLLTQRQDTKP